MTPSPTKNIWCSNGAIAPIKQSLSDSSQVTEHGLQHLKEEIPFAFKQKWVVMFVSEGLRHILTRRRLPAILLHPVLF